VQVVAYYGRLVLVFITMLCVCSLAFCLSLRRRVRQARTASFEVQQGDDATTFLGHHAREERPTDRMISLWLIGASLSLSLPALRVITAEQPTGVPEHVIQSFPITPYHCMSPTHVDRDNKDLCAICLVDYEEDEAVRALLCGHRFHPSCIDEWLRQSIVCPM
jgi:hypothetical protein